ncbi:MAG: hypothetical protein ACLFNP_09345, partial [Spirochaetaceae bacterium]
MSVEAIMEEPVLTYRRPALLPLLRARREPFDLSGSGAPAHGAAPLTLGCFLQKSLNISFDLLQLRA